jgi:hypothetical protein
LDLVPARRLKLFKVSFPAEDLGAALKHFRPEDNDLRLLSGALDPLEIVFGDPIHGHLHIIVETLPIRESSSSAAPCP